MNEEKLLTIMKYNKEYFLEDEEVKLILEIKNIPSLTIKIFEIFPENYYHKHQKEIENTINLDGLIASEEKIFEFNEPPIKKHMKEFKFDFISKQK